MKMKTPVFIFGIVIIIVALFLLWSTEENNVAKVPTPSVATTTEEIAIDNTEIIKLIEADIASTEPRTLEISGWKKLSDNQYLNEPYFSPTQDVEIWLPEEWFTYVSYDSGHGSGVPVFRWPQEIEYTQDNKNILWKYAFKLDVAQIGFWTQGSRVLSYNQKKLEESGEYVSFEDVITTENIQGISAKKVVRTFTKIDGTHSTVYSVVFEDSPIFDDTPSNFRFLDISVYDEYINSEEIFNEIVSRIEIKEIKK